MSRRRKPQFGGFLYGQTWIQAVYLRPVEAGRRERVRRQVVRVKRRAARRWTA